MGTAQLSLLVPAIRAFSHAVISQAVLTLFILFLSTINKNVQNKKHTFEEISAGHPEFPI